MNVRIFEFPISNFTGSLITGPLGAWQDKAQLKNLPTTNHQEDEMNEFMSTVDVKDVIVTPLTIMNHSNGGCNTIVIRYTVLYEEQPYIYEDDEDK